MNGFSSEQRANARANSARVNQQRAQQQPIRVDWDEAIAGFKQILDEVYGTDRSGHVL